MADKNLELALRIRADLKQAQQQLRAFESTLNAGAQSAAALGKSQKTIGEVDTRKSVQQLKALDASLDNADRSATQLEKTQRGLGGGFTSLAASVKAATLTLAAGYGLNQITQSADAWTAYQNRLRLVTDSQAELATSSRDVYDIARQTSQSLDATAAVYQRFAQNADQLNLSQERTAALTGTVSKAIAVSGGSATSSEAALVQFGQALASGVLRGEEYNSVSEQASGLTMALAEGLGVTTGELREMANAGELTADVLVTALEAAADSVDEKFQTRVKLISQAAVELYTAFTRIVGTVGELSDTSGVAAGAISGVADVLDKLSDNADILAAALDVVVALGVGKLVGAFANLTAAGLKNIAMNKAHTIALAENAAITEAAAVAAQRAAVAELEQATITAQRAAVQRQAALAAGEASIAEARLGLALEARTAAEAKVALTTRAAAAATATSAAASTAAAAASSVLTRSLITAQAAARGLWLALGGPVGIAVGVGLAALSFIDFGDSAEEGLGRAESALGDLNQPLDQVLQRLQGLSGVERQREFKQLANDIKSLQADISATAEQFADLSDGGRKVATRRGSRRASFDTDTQALLSSLQGAATDSANGVVVDFDRLSKAIEQAGNVSDETKDKLQQMLADIARDSRNVDQLTTRLNELKNAFDNPADGLSTEQTKAATQYIDSLKKQHDKLLQLTPTEEALKYLREQQIDQNSKLGKQILQQVQDNEALATANKKKADAEQAASTAADEAQRKLDQRAKAQVSYVENLEDTVATLGQSKAAARDYELAEMGLSGTLLDRAKAAQAAITAQERLNDLSQIQARLLALDGNNQEARRVELEAEYADLLASGDETGKKLARKLINAEVLKAALDDFKSQLDRIAQSANSQRELLTAQYDAGQISQPQFRAGLTEIDNGALEQLQSLRDTAVEYSTAMSDPTILQNFDAMALGYQRVTEEATRFLADGQQINDMLSGGLTNALMAVADGTMSVGEAFGQFAADFIRKIAEMIIQQAIFNAISGGTAGGGVGGGIAGAIGSVFKAATGGHIRGPGTATSDSIPAMLSDNEFVTRAAVVKEPGALSFLKDFNAHGMSSLDYWAGRVRHATGGLAGVPAPALLAPGRHGDHLAEPATLMSTTLKNSQTFNLIDSPDRIAEVLNSPAGDRAITVMLSRDPAKFRTILGL